MLTGIIYFILIWHVLATVESVYVHRAIGHGYLKLHPYIEELCVLVLWLVSSQLQPGWRKWYVVSHYDHHKYSDSVKDPHSPYHMTFKELCDNSVCSKNISMSSDSIKKYNFLDYNMAIEKTMYWKYRKLGQMIFVVLSTLALGLPGFIVSMLYYIWSNAFVAFVGKWAMHKLGHEPAHLHPTDRSKNVIPITFLFGGEELHGNHHNDTHVCKFSKQWYEFDIGWGYIKLLCTLHLATLTKPYLTAS